MVESHPMCIIIESVVGVIHEAPCIAHRYFNSLKRGEWRASRFNHRAGSAVPENFQRIVIPS